ncbi:MAG: DUF262 domain-containing protein [Planctomycetes bacterium]|nr:DUF262 domain-containing protein [Planctomycetota bacterium]
MKHASRPQSISWFQEQYKAGRLELRPPFQRKPVWLEKQRCSLIESILMEVPIPEVYVQVTQADDGTEEFGVVDGQQRLRTILQFVGLERETDQEQGQDNNNFRLEELPATSPHKDKSFTDVTGDARKRFFQYEICVRFLYTENITEIEDVFKRLNKFAMPLKAQELRNATYHGAFAKLSEKLADDEYWAVNRIVSPAAIRRMADIEMMSDLLIGLLHGPQGGSAKIIDEYYGQYEVFDDDFPDQVRITRLFEKARQTIESLFPMISDTRWGNRADFYSLFVAFGNLLEKHELLKKSEKALRDKLGEFADQVDKRLQDPTAKTSAAAKEYARAIEKGSNDKARRADRHEQLVKLITPFLSEKK